MVPAAAVAVDGKFMDVIKSTIPRESFTDVACPKCSFTSFDQALKLFAYPGGLHSPKPVLLQVIVYICRSCHHEMDEIEIHKTTKERRLNGRRLT